MINKKMLEDTVEKLTDTIIETIERFGQIGDSKILFISSSGKIGMGVLPGLPLEHEIKIGIMKGLGEKFAEEDKNIQAFIMVSECYFAVANKELLSGEKRVSDMEDKKDCAMISVLSVDGDSLVKMFPFENKKLLDIETSNSINKIGWKNIITDKDKNKNIVIDNLIKTLVNSYKFNVLITSVMSNKV